MGGERHRDREREMGEGREGWRVLWNGYYFFQVSVVGLVFKKLNFLHLLVDLFNSCDLLDHGIMHVDHWSIILWIGFLGRRQWSSTEWSSVFVSVFRSSFFCPSQNKHSNSDFFTQSTFAILRLQDVPKNADCLIFAWIRFETSRLGSHCAVFSRYIVFFVFLRDKSLVRTFLFQINC